MQRCVDAGYTGVMSGMPPGKIKDGGAMNRATGKTKYITCCGIHVCAGDQPNLNQGWARASWEGRQKIIADHVYFEMGAYYYLANDVTGPKAEAIKNKFSAYGLCADEYQEFGNIPPQLYVRISNRMVSDYVMTQNNIATPMLKPDSIAVANWWFDEHMTGKYAVFNESAKSAAASGWTIQLEGNFDPHLNDVFPQKKDGDFYDVPYKIMVPKSGTGANLIVPVALSASAVAYASTRIESMFMSLGTAAGVAAKQLVDGTSESVQNVNVSLVQSILVSRFKQQIHVAGPLPPQAIPQWFTVAGAGVACWNGKYALGPGTNGPPMYEQVANTSHALYKGSADGAWRIAVQGVAVAYVAVQGGSLPPATGWYVGPLGHSPAPTLVAGPTPAPGH